MTQDRAQLLITAVDQTRSAFDSIRSNLAKLGDESNRVKGLLAGLGVSLSVAGLAASIKSAIAAADEINKLSQKIGISVEALSTLRYAAQLSDASLETLQKGIKSLSQNITEASTGVGEGAQVFAALGIAVKNTDGSLKTTDTVLLQIADVFANLEDGAVKTSLAVALFGKSGMDLIPFLNQGAAGINQLTAEAERLGLKLTTETVRSAEAFNDNLTALKAASSSLGISLARDFLPELINITNAMREAANEAGTLKALWVGLGGLGNLVFNGTEIKQARDEVKRLQDLVDGARQKISDGRMPVPFMPFNVQFNEAALATLRKYLGQWEQELTAAQTRLKSLTEPKRPNENNPSGKPTEDMQRIACVVSGGQWVGGQCVKPKAGGKPKDTTGAQLAVVKAEAESEFKILKAGLDQQQAALDRALEDRLVSLHDYYRSKTQLEQQAIDQEIQARQKELAAQAVVAASAKDESGRLKAKAEAKQLEAELTILNQRRTEVEIANAHQAAKAEKELRDELARVRDELLDLTGEATAEDRRAAVERQFQPLLDKLRAEGDQPGQAIVTRLIDVKTASADLAALESDFRSSMERMQLAEASLDRQRAAGLLTETQAQERILDLHKQTADQLDALMPRMTALGEAIGPEAGNRVARLRDEIAGLRAVSNDAALALEGSFKDGLAGMFKDLISGTKSASQAVGDLGRHVLATFLDLISRKLASKLFDSLLGGSGGGGSAGGGVGLIGGLAGLFGIKFAEGGFVTGPGTGTSDSIAARLSDGEYVIRSAAVRRVGVAFLDAVNHLDAGPRSPRPVRPAFAQGGLVSTRSPAAPQSLQVSLHPDALHLTLRDWLDGELARMAATR